MEDARAGCVRARVVGRTFFALQQLLELIELQQWQDEWWAVTLLRQSEAHGSMLARVDVVHVVAWCSVASSRL